MNKKVAWITAIVLVLMLGFFGLLLAGFYFLSKPERVTVQPNTILEIYIEGQHPELPSTSPFAKAFGQGGISLIEMRRILREAAKDSNIKSLYLTVPPMGTSWAVVEELRDQLLDFKKSKKPVIVRLTGDMAEEKEVCLASLGDEIYLNPDAGLLINGMAAEISFYKKLMAKLKIEPQFIQFKEYKSPEQYTREKMSPEIRSMLESILTDLQERFIQTVAADRKISPNRLRELIQTGMAPAPVALKEHLVTALGYQDDVKTKLTMTKPDGGKEYRSINAEQYLKAVQSRPYQPRKTKVALLGGLGMIVSGSSDEVWENYMGGETIANRLHSIREDKSIKGVLFRINSPGGSAVGSDKIWREVTQLEKEGRPVVVSMSGVAGSGGYYISMAARKIVAQPSTITGSIGVIFGKFNLKGLYEDWLGITTDRIKLAENADIFSPMNSLTDKQKGQIQSWMQEVYDTFVRKAAAGRKMKFEELEAKAHGRIYTGSQAKQLKLVDELGGFATAVALLKKELKVPESEEIELVLYPKPKSLFQSLMEGDLFKTASSIPSLENYLQQARTMLETPTIWMITPQVEIH